MDWGIGNITLKIDKTVLPLPFNEKYMGKYNIGVNMLMTYKNTLITTHDKNYYDFLAIYEKVENLTILDFDRAYILFQAAKATEQIEGCTAECGVYKGGSSILIAVINPDKNHYAMDTFEGFPDVLSDIDVHKKGGFSDVSLDDIQKLFAEYKNIFMLKGMFSESFKTILNDTFSFVYIDADLYISTIECCDFFYSRLSPGGIMLFDDYLVPDTPGVKKAIDEFFSDKKEFPIILPTHQALVFKL